MKDVLPLITGAAGIALTATSMLVVSANVAADGVTIALPDPLRIALLGLAVTGVVVFFFSMQSVLKRYDRESKADRE